MTASARLTVVKNDILTENPDNEAQRWSSGNGGGGGMESRVAKLESDVEHIKVTMNDMKSDLKTVTSDVGAMKAKISVIESNYATKEDISSVRIEVHKAIANQTKWMAATMLGIAAAAMAIAKLIF